jgi:23S rRNA (uracil1939-C5)-methyltransferase
VVGTSIERFRVPSARIVVADPSRAGLGRKAVKVLAAAGADRFVLVSCDPAAAGRDLALLAAEGYRPVETVVVDMFPHTHHVEVVTRLDRM